MPTANLNLHYIDSDSALQQAADHWLSLPAIGIDTEFIRTDTFHPQPALLQFSDGEQCWLVDVLRIRAFEPVSALLANPAVVKIVHACGEDLEVFDQLVGALPQPLFDTQIAAAFCGHGPAVGYSKLVQTLFDIELSKEQCRSDWLARPLSAEQQHYAGLDVLHLPAMYRELSLQLQQRERSDWNHEENRRQIERFQLQRQSPYNIERLSNAWKLDDEARRRLYHLLLGRDALARQYNRPRNHIAKDHALLEIARRPPRRREELAAIDGLRPSGIRQFGEHLITLAHKVPDDLVCPPLAEPLGKQENDKAKRLRALVEQLATHLDIPPELVIRRAEIEQLVRQHASGHLALPARFDGWRTAQFGNAILDEIRSW